MVVFSSVLQLQYELLCYNAVVKSSAIIIIKVKTDKSKKVFLCLRIIMKFGYTLQVTFVTLFRWEPLKLYPSWNTSCGVHPHSNKKIRRHACTVLYDKLNFTCRRSAVDTSTSHETRHHDAHSPTPNWGMRRPICISHRRPGSCRL